MHWQQRAFNVNFKYETISRPNGLSKYTSILILYKHILICLCLMSFIILSNDRVHGMYCIHVLRTLPVQHRFHFH